jgi:hypothetical protein
LLTRLFIREARLAKTTDAAKIHYFFNCCSFNDN